MLLSIVGIHQAEGNAHYAGKREQERPKARYADVAGPEPQDLVDMTRRTYAARGRTVRIIPSWSGRLGLDMSGNVLLPGPNAHLARTTFDEWLSTEEARA